LSFIPDRFLKPVRYVVSEIKNRKFDRTQYNLYRCQVYIFYEVISMINHYDINKYLPNHHGIDDDQPNPPTKPPK
jgi:hypothetical protein